GVIDEARVNPSEAVLGSQVVVLAVPVGAIIDLITRLAPSLPEKCLLTDVGSTKFEVLKAAQAAFGKNVSTRFLPGHPMAGKEHPGVEYADPEPFSDAAWLLTPSPGQKINQGLAGEFLGWVKKLGARVATMEADEHDALCAWISHIPQFTSTALAAAL